MNKLLKDSFHRPLLNFMAGMFSKKVINLDEITFEDLEKKLFIDEKAYSAYKNDYIKKGERKNSLSGKLLPRRLSEGLKS